MSAPYIKVDFDPSYLGGPYKGKPNTALVPQALAYEHGTRLAFERVTGHSHANIVKIYDWMDDLVNADGTKWEPNVDLVAEAEQDIQVPLEENIQMAEDEPIIIEDVVPIEIEAA